MARTEIRTGHQRSETRRVTRLSRARTALDEPGLLLALSCVSVRTPAPSPCLPTRHLEHPSESQTRRPNTVPSAPRRLLRARRPRALYQSKNPLYPSLSRAVPRLREAICHRTEPKRITPFPHTRTHRMCPFLATKHPKAGQGRTLKPLRGGREGAMSTHAGPDRRANGRRTRGRDPACLPTTELSPTGSAAPRPGTRRRRPAHG